VLIPRGGPYGFNSLGDNDFGTALRERILAYDLQA
jgi:hypothetical protein